MLHIIHAEETSSPSQTYAHRLWRENPSITPTWWREMLGHTVSKIALDWRTSASSPSLLEQGINVVLTTPATYAQAAKHLSHTNLPAAMLHLCLSPQPVPQPGTLTLWHPPLELTDAEALAALTELERASTTYGLYDPLLSSPSTRRPLHRWLEIAAQAAEAAHGRRKRPALHLLMLDLDLINLSPITVTNTLHKNEPVSALELASRLGLAVIAPPPTPAETSPPAAAALRALTAMAEAEKSLQQHLGGWPAMENRPLFSVLAHLAQGLAPWPTVAHWLIWQSHVWPLMENFLTLNPAAASQNLLAAARNLMPHGPALADFSARQAQANRLAQLSGQLPAGWNPLSPAWRQNLLLSSIPGLAVLAVTPPDTLQDIQKIEDFPDASILFVPPSQSS